MIDLGEIFQRLNKTYFNEELLEIKISYNTRLRSAAGRFFPGQQKIMFDHYPYYQIPPKIDVAAYLLKLPDGDMHIEDTIKHEMIHYWLWENDLPYGHNALFKKKMKEIGATMYNPVPIIRPPKYLYACPGCEKEFRAKRRFRNKACLQCCKEKAGGKYDVRFKLYLKEQDRYSEEMKKEKMEKESAPMPAFSAFLKAAFFGLLLFSVPFSTSLFSAETKRFSSKKADLVSHQPLNKIALDKVWIQVSSGALSCDDPKEAAKESDSLMGHENLLKKLKIKVFSSKSANDGKMRAQMCGIPKGDEHQFLILKKDLKKAEKNGFQLMTGASSSSP